MRCLLLGTGGYHPNERRHTACVFFPAMGIVLDAGTSFFRVPPRLQTDTLKIFLSHAHLDHVAGLTYPLVPLLTGKLKRIEIYGEVEKINAVKNHLFSEYIFPVKPEFEFHTLNPGETVELPEGGKLHTHQLKHPGGSMGFRLNWPQHSICYTTDTTVDGSYDEFVRDVNVLIHECYFPDELARLSPETGHSNTTPVAELAKRTNVGKLYLTHIDPQRDDDDPIGMETARKIFPETILAEDLMEIDF